MQRATEVNCLLMFFSYIPYTPFRFQEKELLIDYLLPSLLSKMEVNYLKRTKEVVLSTSFMELEHFAC